MPQTKRAAQRKRRSKVVLALGAAGLSLSLGGSASAAIGGVNPDTVSQQVMLYEEEIADVSLATFRVFDKERAGIHKGRTQRMAMGVGGCGCVPAAAALVGSVCIITTHRRCLATRSIRRRLGRSARRTNINLTARASHNDLQLLFTKAQQGAQWAFKRGFQAMLGTRRGGRGLRYVRQRRPAGQNSHAAPCLRLCPI